MVKGKDVGGFWIYFEGRANSTLLMWHVGERGFKMTNVLGLSKQKNGVTVNCDKEEIRADLGGKISTVLYISCLGCLLHILMEIWNSWLAYDLEFSGEFHWRPKIEGHHCKEVI